MINQGHLYNKQSLYFYLSDKYIKTIKSEIRPKKVLSNSVNAKN